MVTAIKNAWDKFQDSKHLHSYNTFIINMEWCQHLANITRKKNHISYTKVWIGLLRTFLELSFLNILIYSIDFNSIGKVQD